MNVVEGVFQTDPCSANDYACKPSVIVIMPLSHLCTLLRLAGVVFIHKNNAG